MTIWTHSQGTFDVHRVAAELLSLPPEKVHAIHVEGSGCYGQNGADDVAAEAAVTAKVNVRNANFGIKEDEHKGKSDDDSDGAIPEPAKP